jgi:Uma2 family endonuclease
MSVATEFVPLESGDRLTRDEFHRRYSARPDIKKAELIEGVVYVASPASFRHSEPHASVVGWLHAYKIRRAGLRLGIEATIVIGDNEVQPDACLFRESAGHARLFEDQHGTQYVEGAPELIVEIAASSASYDLHSKRRVYERGGVSEYIVWQVYERRIDWFRLRDGVHVRVEPDERGVIESEVFHGLRLHVAKMLAGDDAGVVAELDEPAP